MRRLLVLLAVVLPSATTYAQVGMRVEEVRPGSVRVDGSLRDWRGVRFVDVGAGDDAHLRYALRYDREGVYVAAVVKDERFVRTARPGTDEDAVILTVAAPAARGRYRAVDVWLYAGIPGRQAASAAVGRVGRRARPLRQARIVEGPLRRGGSGYVLEAFVPARALPGGARWHQGRGAIRLRDVDREARPEVESEPSSASVDPRHLDRLPSFVATGGEDGMLRDFLRSRDLHGTRPRHDFRGDVSGDRRPERVLIVDRYALVMGDGYREGRAFDFFDLPVVGAAGVRGAELVDLTGDGKRELVVTLRQSNDLGSRDLWQVYSIDEQQIRPVFGLEIRKQTGDGFVESRVRVRPARRGAAFVEAVAGRASGLDASNLREAPAAGVEAMLLPWGSVVAKTWQWDGSRFAVVRERPNPQARAEQEPAARARGRTRRRTRARSSEPEAATAPGVNDLVAAFKREAGLPPRTRPRFRQVVNVAEGREEEHVMVLGSALLVVGPGFRGGTGWFHFGLPVAAPSDVLSVETADLTGDGRQEILLRLRRSAEDVDRELLLVHQFRPTGFPRLLAVEVAREQGGNRLENEVRVSRARRGSVLSIGPGRARGWDGRSWPFADGTGDGVDPLLLPWRDAAVRYEYRGGQLVR